MKYRNIKTIPGLIIKTNPPSVSNSCRINLPPGFVEGGFLGGGGFNSMPPQRVKKILGSNQNTTITNRSDDANSHLQQPLTKSGKPDKRYKSPQICKKDGTRDKRYAKKK